jgi:hypothetical protein
MLEAFTDLRVIIPALLFTIGSEVNGGTGNYEVTLIKGQVKFPISYLYRLRLT